MKISTMGIIKKLWFAICAGLLIAGCIFGTFSILKLTNEANQSKTIELTIEHLWEENNKCYFADNNGSVYELGNYRDVSDKIVYSELPKQRFDKLNEGSRYEIKYISGMDFWISISEVDIKNGTHIVKNNKIWFDSCISGECIQIDSEWFIIYRNRCNVSDGLQNRESIVTTTDDSLQKFCEMHGY